VTLQPSTRLGAYEILSSIGAGGMGGVYRAREIQTDSGDLSRTFQGALSG
jgi:hypothetical protein